jgi:hypothetical protein
MGGLFSALTNAINSGSATSALTALGNLQTVLGTSNAVKSQVGLLTLQYEMAQAKTPPDLVTMSMVCQSLVGLIPSLPKQDAADIQELGTPAIEENPAAAAGVIAQIQQSLA